MVGVNESAELRALRALVPCMHRALRAVVPHVPCSVVPHVHRVLRALVPRALCSLVLHVPPTLHALLLTTMISNLYHGDISMPLLKEYYYSGFFISDLSLQDPLTYVNVTTLIQQQPAFIRKPAL